MSENLDDFNEIRVNIEGEIEKIIGKQRNFPLYTTQLINIANQNAQGTRPRVVGQMSELIKKCEDKTYIGWKNWYLKKHPNTIENATDKIIVMIENMKTAMNAINRDMVKDWVEDLVIDKTYEGLIIQDIILKTIAEIKGLDYRGATPKEESQNIDGYIGDQPVQIKAASYLGKKSSVREKITIPIIYYKKTEKYLKIYYGRKSVSSKIDNYF